MIAFAFAHTVLAGVDIGGEYRYRYWNDKTVDSGAESEGRFLWGTSFREGDQLSANLSVLFNHQFGGEGLSAERDVFVLEASGAWTFRNGMELKFGRFGIDWSGGKVFSVNDWELNPTVWDGLALFADVDAFKIGLYHFSPTGGDVDGQIDLEDSDFLAARLSFLSLPGFVQDFNLFYVKHDGRDEDGDPVGSYTKYGATVGGSLDIFDYSVTFAIDSFDDFKEDASMLDAEVAFDVPMGEVFVGYHADEAGYEVLGYDKHNNAGWADQYSWGNLTYYSVGYTYAMNDMTSVGVGYYDFSETDATEDGTEESLATELDVFASHKYNDVLTVMARYSTVDFENEGEEKRNQFMLGITMNF